MKRLYGRLSTILFVILCVGTSQSYADALRVDQLLECGCSDEHRFTKCDDGYRCDTSAVCEPVEVGVDRVVASTLGIAPWWVTLRGVCVPDNWFDELLRDLEKDRLGRHR